MSKALNLRPRVRRSYLDRVRTQFKSDQVSKIQQDTAEQADINYILKQFNVTGEINSENRGTPMYGDYSNVGDYNTALNRVTSAERLFAELPARMRERFENNPAKLLSYVSDPKNLDACIDLGLIQAPENYQKPSPPKPGSVPPAVGEPTPPATPPKPSTPEAAPAQPIDPS